MCPACLCVSWPRDPCGQSGPWGCHEVGRRGPELSLFSTPALSTAPQEPGSQGSQLTLHPYPAAGLQASPLCWSPGQHLCVCQAAQPQLPMASVEALSGAAPQLPSCSPGPGPLWPLLQPCFLLRRLSHASSACPPHLGDFSGSPGPSTHLPNPDQIHWGLYGRCPPG